MLVRNEVWVGVEVLVEALLHHQGAGAGASAGVPFEMLVGAPAEVLLETIARAQVEVSAGAQIGEGKVWVSVEAHYVPGLREVLAEVLWDPIYKEVQAGAHLEEPLENQSVGVLQEFPEVQAEVQWGPLVRAWAEALVGHLLGEVSVEVLEHQLGIEGATLGVPVLSEGQGHRYLIEGGVHQEVFLLKGLLSASGGGVVLVSVIHLLEDTEHPLHLLSGHTVTMGELNVIGKLSFYYRSDCLMSHSQFSTLH